MKTRCYCTSCPNHPKFEQRHELGYPPTGFQVDRYLKVRFEPHGADVNCLKPVSAAFDAPLHLDPEDFDYPITAYGDGSAQTGMLTVDLILYASCGNKRYED